MDEARKDRIARNEVAFRKVNEAIEAGRTEDDERRRLPFLCECGAIGCNQLIDVTVAEYEDVRSNPRRFFIVPGHEEPEVESVVGGTDRFNVVEKHEEEADIPEATDPRS